MNISYNSFDLVLKFPFTIAKFSRTSTPLILLEIKYEGFTGLGEASMVPYMGESIDTAVAFLSKIDLKKFNYPFAFDEILANLDEIQVGMPAIKAAIDIALHDLTGKIENLPCYQLFKADPDQMPLTTYTIGIDKPDIVIKKVEDALSHHFKLLKIKLGRDSDKELVKTIRSVSDLPLYVDANQGWVDKNLALDMIYWLTENNVILIEQPMSKDNIDDHAWLSEHSPIPIIGDEAVQRLADVEKAVGVYNGINVKLMKSAGMYEAHQMILKAKKLDLKILIGCMSETSIATLAGAALAPLCDWADLDGPFLTSNNPYQTPHFKDGKYVLSKQAGLGVQFKS